MAREFRATASAAATKGGGRAGLGRLLRLLWPADIPDAAERDLLAGRI